jgi:WhiB family transcriptional regulator, redox-sensing transcriptional regulator
VAHGEVREPSAPFRAPSATGFTAGGATVIKSSVFDWDDDGWREQAACRYTGADLFFPVGNTGLAVEQIDAAKAVCRSCPVQDPCLRFAFETNQQAGVWGGTDEDERRRLRRKWRADRLARRRSEGN